MLILFLILIITLMSLIVVLWGGTIFIQGYVYTEPSAGIPWRAPVLAGLLTFGYTVWCLSVAFWNGASPSNIPIDTIFRFNPKEDMLAKPAAKLWAIKANRKKTENGKDGESVLYVSRPDYDKLHGVKYQYVDADSKLPWHGSDVIAIEIQPEGETAKIRFDRVETQPGQYPHFVSSDGWVMAEFEQGPTGKPEKVRWGRLFLNLFFNAAHFAAWFLGLWLVLRYQWLHALGVAVVLWLIMTLLILPMMLGYAGQVSDARRSATAAIPASRTA